jgi:hypothetical protein
MLLAILTGRSIDLGQHRSLDLFPALLIFKLGLIDEVLAPASTNKRPVPEWQCHTAKAKSSASTRTDMHVNERTVGRSGSLFVWVAGMGNGLIGLVHLKMLSLASGCIISRILSFSGSYLA